MASSYLLWWISAVWVSLTLMMFLAVDTPATEARR
jgi:hypothetical protein